MKNVTKIVGAVAIAGVIAAGSSAFTAGGLTNSAGESAGFIGGQISQSVTGATLNSVAYTFVDPAVVSPVVSLATLVFAGDVSNRVVTFNANTAALPLPADAVDFECADGVYDGGTTLTTVECEPASPMAAIDKIQIRVAATP